VVGSLALLRLLAVSHPKLVNEYLCCLVLEGCAATRRMSYAEGVLRVMADLQIERSVFVYGALLKGFGRQRWGREVEALWQELLTQQVRPACLIIDDSIIQRRARRRLRHFVAG
jgi:pentatricopeptide repeat protein